MSQEKLRRFEEQVSPHLKSAYNLAKWLTRSHEDAEDVVQEAFLRAFSAFESLRNEDAKPWLLTIVRNTSMTWLEFREAVVLRERDLRSHWGSPRHGNVAVVTRPRLVEAHPVHAQACQAQRGASLR